MAGADPAGGARLAAFDFDGTLLDSAEAIVATVQACWDVCGFPAPDPDSVRRTIGLPWEESVRILLPGAGEAEFRKIRTFYEEIRQGARPRPFEGALFAGVRPTLDALLAEGWLLAIVTSRTRPHVQELLEEHRIDGYFAAVRTADMGPGKPHPYLLLDAIAALGAAPRRTAMIGDTVFDMETAIRAGAAAVGVSWGLHDVGALRAAGAHRIVHSFGELRPSIAELAAGRR